jgi:hypothetical protein
MSALGIWNNRYEGGPCYAACMETFTLYLLTYSVITPPSNTAGEAATTEQEELMTLKAETRPPECVKGTLLNRCGHSLASLRKFRI